MGKKNETWLALVSPVPTYRSCEFRIATWLNNAILYWPFVAWLLNALIVKSQQPISLLDSDQQWGSCQNYGWSLRWARHHISWNLKISLLHHMNCIGTLIVHICMGGFLLTRLQFSRESYRFVLTWAALWNQSKFFFSPHFFSYLHW